MNRMIKNVTIIVVINLLFWSSGFGKENEDPQTNKFGLGVMTERGSKIYFPITLSNKLRLEPEISFNQNEFKKDNYESEYKAFSMGMGILSLTNTEKITTYYGVRIGYTKTVNSNEFYYITQEGISKNTAIGYYISPVAGAEYLFAKRFSIGPEISIQYTSTNGKETRNDSNDNPSSTSLLLKGGVLLRFYIK